MYIITCISLHVYLNNKTYLRMQHSPNIRSAPDICVLLLDVINGTDINPPGITDITTGAVDPGCGGGRPAPESLLENVPEVTADDRVLDIEVDVGERADVCWPTGEPLGEVLPDTPI